MLFNTNYSVVVVGAGTTGAASAYHLAKEGIQNILVLDAGDIGEGVNEPLTASEHYKPFDKDETEGIFPFARKSGSAVLPEPVAPIKMMVTVYPCSSAEFIEHHGEEGARRYIALAKQGIKIEKTLAKELLPNADENIRCLGSLYVAEAKAAHELEEEYRTLRACGCDDIELWDQDQVEAAAGGSAAKFTRGIYFPADAIINSQLYAKCLLKEAQATSSVTVASNTRVASVTTTGDRAITILASGERIVSDYVVMATGGLYLDPALNGLLKPCWSYLVSVPVEHPPALPREGLAHPNSINLFTWGFTHDWSMVNGYIRCSGEDHFSALKPPRAEDRCASLAKWVQKKYPSANASTYGTQYGVYSETPDKCPLVGRMNPKSRVCYVLGCNAWGQASLSYAASLVPALLGFRPMTDVEDDLFALLDITRFALLPGVLDGATPVA